MREIKHSALVSATPGQVYELIADVERYPEFLPWCTSARIEAREPGAVVATLGVRRGLLRSEFTTRNALDPGRSVSMRLVRGPFRELEGDWTLTPIGARGTRVDLHMRFALANPLTAAMLEPLFAEITSQLVDAFVARARALPT